MAETMQGAHVGDASATGEQPKPARGATAHEVFVSYSHRDKPVADAVVARLEQSGVRCWIAPRDVLPGSVWAQAIIQAISTTRLLVVVLSREANESPQVLREVERAIAAGVVVIPFRIEAVEPTDAMAYYLASQHWLDALTPPLDAHIAALVQVVEALCERTSEPAAPARPEATDLDGSLDGVCPAAAAGARLGLGRTRRWLLIAGGLLAVVGILGAAVLLTSRGGTDPTGSADPAAADGTADETATERRDPEATARDDSSSVAEEHSNQLLEDLYRDCSDGVRASCRRLWFESEGHPDEPELGDFATSQLWRLSAAERWGIDIPDGPLPTSYGSHAELDRLYEACDAGEEAACTDLLWSSPPFSEYVDLARPSFEHRPSSWDVGHLVSWWLVLTSSERAFECGDYGRDAAGLVADWEEMYLSRDTVMQFYNDHCGIERTLD